MQVNLSKEDIVWSYIGTILSMSANILMLPIIIYYLDSEMLGLWYVFGSIGGIALLFDFGFSVTLARNITYCWSGSGSLKKTDVEFADNSEPNYQLMKRVLYVCKNIYLLISLIALLLLFTIGSYYIYTISYTIEGYDHFIAWFIYSLAVFFNLYYGYYSLFLRGVGAISDANKNTIIARLAQILLTVTLLVMGFGIIGVCLAYFSYGFLFRYLGKYKFYNYRRIGEHLKSENNAVALSSSIPLFKTIWYNGWREGLISISNYISGYASTIICSLFLTLSETGTYSVGVQIAMALALISSTFNMSSQPQLQAAYVNKDKEKISKTIAISIVSLLGIFFLGVLLILTIFLPFLKWIKPESIVPVPVFLALSFYQIVLKIRDCYASYFSSTNRIPYIWAFVLSSSLGVILSIIFIVSLGLGVWGIILAQLISQLCFNCWYWPYKANKELEVNIILLTQKGIKTIKDSLFNK